MLLLNTEIIMEIPDPPIIVCKDFCFLRLGVTTFLVITFDNPICINHLKQIEEMSLEQTEALFSNLIADHVLK